MTLNKLLLRAVPSSPSQKALMMMPFNDSGVGKFSRLRFKDLSGWLSKLENVYKLGGEICARPLVQERVEKAMRRVVTEDCSLVILCLRSASSTRFSSAVDSGNDARVTERDDIRLGVTLPPLAGIATAFLVRRGICAMTKAKPSRQKEKPNEARRTHRISTRKALPICCHHCAIRRVAWPPPVSSPAPPQQSSQPP